MKAGIRPILFSPCSSGLFLAALLLAGCGAKSSFQRPSVAKPASAELHGKSMGGQQPVVGSTIQLYAAGSLGYGTGAQAMLSPAVTTDQTGGFSIPAGAYTCPSSSAEMYIVATGGDPGVGSNNPAIAMMAALGPCGNLSSTTFVTINEVTTVGSVWPLAQFLGYGGGIGATAANGQGLANAFANVNNIVNVGSGNSPGPTAPTGATIPTAAIYTLADILATCVNGSSSACSSLFAAATPPGGTAPTNTLDAALNIARNPGNNVVTLYGLQTPAAPFQPTLASSPFDLTVGVTYYGEVSASDSPLNNPTGLAVDSTGNVWIGNGCGSLPCGSVIELSNAGQLLFTSPFTGGGVNFGTTGIAIDAGGNIWYSNQRSPSQTNNGNGSIIELSSSGTPEAGIDGCSGYEPVVNPHGLATDTNGTLWMVGGVVTSPYWIVMEMTNAGTSGCTATVLGAGTLAGVAKLAVDANHSAWIPSEDEAGPLVEISPASTSNPVTVYSYLYPGGFIDWNFGVGTDAIGTGNVIGHLWVTNLPQGVGLIELESNGSATFLTAQTGLASPYDIAIDGAGNAWGSSRVLFSDGGVLYHAAVVELESAGGTTPGTILSPTKGFGGAALFQQYNNLAIDASGNLWATAGDQITQFLGLASPVQTPLIGPAKPI